MMENSPEGGGAIIRGMISLHVLLLELILLLLFCYTFDE